jgi:hypothetical protein
MKWTLLFLVFIIFFASCKEGEQPSQATPKQEATFDYYPRANIYYSIEQKYFFVFDSAQNVWLQKNNLSPEENRLLSKKVIISNPSSPVYLDNEHHRLIYGTILYSSSEEIHKKFIEDSLKLINAKKSRRIEDSLKTSITKKVNPQVEKEKKTRNGLKNFFDRIFKKKQAKPLPPPTD